MIEGRKSHAKDFGGRVFNQNMGKRMPAERPAVGKQMLGMSRQATESTIMESSQTSSRPSGYNRAH